MTRTANVVLVVLLSLVLPATIEAGPVESATPVGGVSVGDGVPHRAVPGTVWYQGFLADVDTGNPINDTVEIVAELFDSAVDGTGLWGPETHGGITVVEGWFNIELGSTVSPLPGFDTPPYYLQLTVNGEAFGSRMKLASAPTAIHAGAADGGGGGGIGGGGDPGYIPVFTTGSEISNSVMLQTSGRISIDSSTSDAKLRVESAGGLPPVKIVNTSSGNVPSMLHIERTQEIAYDDHMLYMTAPSANYGSNFIQCEIGTAKAVETKFVVRADGGIIGDNLYLSSDLGYVLTAETGSGNSSSRTINAEYRGSEIQGTAVYGYSEASWGQGGYFVGNTGTSSWGVGNGSSDCSGTNSSATALGEGDSYGVYASASGGTTAYGIYATAYGADHTEWAGYFDGDVHSTGTITSAKSGFEIDHPGDPAGAYLRHAYVASPEMKTVTDGSVVLDASGRASVALPDWFQTLNTEMRYQLTAIGSAAPNLHVASEISGNMFAIAGGEPGMKVCWQVTGVRKDRAALADPLTVESDKPFGKHGKYVSPAAFGMPRELGIGVHEIKNPPQDKS